MQSRSNKLRQRLVSLAGHLRGKFEYFSHPESSILVYEVDEALVGDNLRRVSLIGANLERTNLRDVKVDGRVAEQIREFNAKQTRQ